MELATTVQRFGDWAASLRLSDIPSRVADKIRLQILTAISAAAAAPWHESARAASSTFSAPGRALVLATGELRDPREAALANSAFSMALDYDDYMLCGHTGHTAVLIPLAFAGSVAEVVVAAAVANEIMGRISTNCLIGPLNGQMSAYIHSVGAAAALGTVLRLPGEQLAHAIALSLYEPVFPLVPGFWTEGSKTLTAVFPAENGVRAAFAAASGVRGPLDILDHPQGFSSRFSFADFPGLYDGLGAVWFSDTLSFKRYPGTSYISAAVEAALHLSAAGPVRADDIDEITVETTILSSTLDTIGDCSLKRSPLDANAINFSLKLSVAAALVFGNLTVDCFRPEAIARHEREIRALAHKITVVHDLEQTIAMVAASPLGVAVISRLSTRQLARLIGHQRRLKSTAAPLAPRPRLALFGAAHALRELVPMAARSRRRPVSALSFTPDTFQMRQSAAVAMRRGHVLRRHFVPIPLGASGRAEPSQRDVVAWRCEQALGSQRAKGVCDLVLDGTAPIAELQSLLAASEASA